MDKIRFLHIAKTGGTTLNNYLKEYKKRHRRSNLRKHRHRVTLAEACRKDPDAKIAFFVREPASRFAAGFYSRLREGRPSHYRKWNSREARAFRWFKTPNQLAEALSSLNPFTRLAAELAIRGIGHVRRDYSGFLVSVACLEKFKNQIAFIGMQENYEADFARMIRILNLDPDIPLASDEKKGHRAPKGEDRAISEKGRANLRNRYSQDEPIYQWCLKHRQEILARHGME